MNVAQTIVAGMATAQFQLGLAGRQIQLVVHHQNFLGLNFVKTGQCRHRLATQIHESLRFQQPDGLPLDRGSGHQAVVALVHLQRGFERPGQFINPPKTSVVAGRFVFWPWITQAHEEFDHEGALRANA